jgi:hypothetical protein
MSKIQNWIQCRERFGEPSRTKYTAVVYSDQLCSQSLEFKLLGGTLSISPIGEGERSMEYLDGYLPAFHAEYTISHAITNKNKIRSLNEALDFVLPLMAFDYRVSGFESKFDEFNGEWVEALNPRLTCGGMSYHKDLPRRKLIECIGSLAKLMEVDHGRKKIAVSLKDKLREALRLSSTSARYSFLSYYNILELISDDLAKRNEIPSGDSVAKEISEFSLSTKGSQRNKIYFLSRAISNDFNLEDCLALCEVRNKLAHAESAIDPSQYNLCADLAHWMVEEYIIWVAKLHETSNKCAPQVRIDT